MRQHAGQDVVGDLVADEGLEAEVGQAGNQRAAEVMHDAVGDIGQRAARVVDGAAVERLAGPQRRFEDVARLAGDLLRFGEDGDGLRRQMDEVGAFLLRARGGDFPEPGVEVEFRPFGIGDFALALAGEYQQLHRGDGDGVGFAAFRVVQRAPDFGQLVEPQGDIALDRPGVEVLAGELFDAGGFDPFARFGEAPQALGLHQHFADQLLGGLAFALAVGNLAEGGDDILARHVADFPLAQIGGEPVEPVAGGGGALLAGHVAGHEGVDGLADGGARGFGFLGGLARGIHLALAPQQHLPCGGGIVPGTPRILPVAGDGAGLRQ